MRRPAENTTDSAAADSPRVDAVVIHVGPDPRGRGGMATVSSTLLSSDLNRRYDLRMVSSHRTGSAVTRLRIFGRMLIALRRNLRSTDAPVIVHVHAAAYGSMYRKAIVVFLAHRWGAKVILHVHTGAGAIKTFADGLDPIRRKLLASALRRSDVLLSASAAAADQLTISFGLPSATIVNNPLPDPPPSQSATRAPAAVTELLYLGGFANPVKGGQILLDALAEKPESLAVTLAGPGVAPAQAESVGRWVGWLDGAAKSAALQRADIVVIPSTSEGLPVAMLEAMSYGKAVIATRVGAMPDVMTDGHDGVLVPSDDLRALHAAILGLAADPERRAQLGRHARLRAADYSTDRVVEQLDAIYQRLLTGESGHE